MAAGVERSRLSGAQSQRHPQRGRQGGRLGTSMQWETILPLAGLVVDWNSVVGPDRPLLAVSGSRCHLCGQVPRRSSLLEPDGDAWRCTARRACAVRGPDPLTTGAPA